jgi:opacity protein-like surface antigen
MKRLCVSVSVFCLCLLCFSAVVCAQSEDPRNYVVLKGGAFFPKGDLRELNTGFNGEVAVGRKFHPNFALEFGSGYLQASRTFSGPEEGISFTEKVDAYAIPITLALKGIIPIGKQAEVYALGGGGAYYAHLKITESDVTPPSISRGEFVAGGFLGAGISYNINPQWFLGLEGKYLWMGNLKLSATSGGEEVSANIGFEGIQATFNIGYRF